MASNFLTTVIVALLALTALKSFITMSFRFLTTIPVIVLIIAAKTHGSIDDIVPGTQADGAKCDINRSEFWNFINWYFSRSQIMRVVLLSRSPDMSNYTDIFNNVIQRLVHNTRLPMIISSRDLTYEDDRIGYSDRYSWQGTLFPLRPAQQQTAQRTRRKRQAPAIGDEAAVPAITTPGRKDEPQHGILVIVESLQILDDYLTGSARSPFRSPRDNYIVIVRFSSDNVTDANNSTTDGRRWPEQVESIVRRLWTDYGIANVYLMAPCEDASDGTVGTVASYFPFLLRSTNDSAAPPDGGEPLTADEYGRCRWWTVDRMEYSMRSLRRMANMRGYPFRVSIFERYPTALPVNRMSQVLARSYFNNIARLSGGFAGFDGLVLGNMAERLNFRSVVVSPSGGSDFGWVGANGSFYGSIGDVLYRRAQISVNGRFVAEYGTDEIDFMYPVYFDDFCIVAPKALMIPEWLAIFRCFSKTVWALIVGTIVVCACGWYLLQRWTHFKYKQNLHRRTSISNATICYQPNFFAVFIEMWIIYFSAASTHMPGNQLERIFMTACLLGNLIIVGSFQGSLTTSFSTTAYYKDIDTLSELDASGLPIGTTSASLADIFGTGDTPVLLSLISKFRVSAGGGQATIDRTAYNRDTCCIERCADIKLIIVDKYEKPDGTVLLHPMRESPKTCHIAYVVKKGWPFFPVFQDLIHRFTEAGLMQKWYEQNQQSIIQEKRIQRRIESDDQHVLTMVDLQTSFYLLVLGQLFSVMLFVAEIIHARWFK